MKYFIGVSALHHDSAACLIDANGEIVNISHEERRTKIKGDKTWPTQSINWCLNDGYARRGTLGDLNYRYHKNELETIEYGYYEKPGLKFFRRVYANPKKILKYWSEACIPEQKLNNYKVLSHHKSHAIAGCATAPFDKGVYLIVDAIGEWNTITWGSFNHTTGIKQDGKINYPNSLGLLYSSFTRWLGLKPLEDEYIVMSAAAYGEPKYIDRIFDEFISLNPDGTFYLKKNIYLGVEQYLGHEVPIEDWYDWCASIQAVCEKVMVSLVMMLQVKYGYDLNLVLGGSVALNCVANTRVVKDCGIKNFWALPSPGDSGNALGAAAYAAGVNKLKWVTPFLGADIDGGSQPTSTLIRDIVGRLERGEVIGWVQGREEFGPRALGHRSLICDPRNPEAKDKLNTIKNRQTFRPFSPAVLEENAFSYFDMPGNPEWHRYMQLISRVRNPEALPAIAHVDNTARVQTVPKSIDPFRRLLEHWYQSTQCAVLLNTSLNVKGRPLISERKDAIKMLLDTSMDALVIGNRLYWKEEKVALSEDGSPVAIAEYKDYSEGTDSVVAGRF